jgi:DNA repair ATPase RecN
MAGDDDWSEYRKLILASLQRVEAQGADVQKQVHEINQQMANIKSDVQRHNNHDARIASLEALTVRYNTILAVIGALALSAWGVLIKRLFDR